MTIDRDHPGIAGGASAPGLALALADAWRPDAGLTREGGRDLDVTLVRGMTEIGSRGERTMAQLLLAFWGEQPVLLSGLDALDLPTRRLVADAFRVLARLG